MPLTYIFFRYRLISIGYTSQDCLGLDLQSLTSISATIFVVSKNWLFLLWRSTKSPPPRRSMILPYFTVEFAKHGKNNCVAVTKNHQLFICTFMAINFVVVPVWTSTTFWSIVSKYRFRKFSLHILPKHFRDPSTLIWHFPISYVLCIFQFSLSIPGGDKARSVQSVSCQWRKKSLRRIFSPR